MLNSLITIAITYEVHAFSKGFMLTIFLTDGSSGPLVNPLKVIRTGFLVKGANNIKGSRKYPIDL